MSMQRQPFLLNYFKTLSRGPTRAWTLASQLESQEWWPQHHSCWCTLGMTSFVIYHSTEAQKLKSICFVEQCLNKFRRKSAKRIYWTPDMSSVRVHCIHSSRAETKALIGGVYIHIFAFCPTNFFWNQLSLQLISKEIRRAEREYMNMHPPPQLTL